MLNVLFPDLYVKSVFDIDFNEVYNDGYEGLIFDIDSTLVPHGADSTKEIDDLFKVIHKIGFKTIFLSNNSTERIESFNKNINTDFIEMANKPHKNSYLRAIEKLDIDRSKVLLIGDQIFTDILGANLCKIDNVLVKYLLHEGETKIGKKRRVEKMILNIFSISKKFTKNSSKIQKNHKDSERKRKNLSELFPVLYTVAVQKEVIKRHVKNKVSRKSFSNTLLNDKLPNVIYRSQSKMIKTGKDIDPVLQENKAFNLERSSSKINSVVIDPGEEFSFWKLVGKANRKNGYKDGRVIINNKVQAGTGGGLCNLANTINLLIIHSPLKITEVHYHSDALAPEKGERKPLANGTSVSYNYVDYRFKNNTDQKFQICIWCENKELIAELRSERALPYQYKIIEKDHQFVKENDVFYRKSKIYKVTENKDSSKELDRELLLNNHSQVMFDYSLIPEDQITS